MRNSISLSVYFLLVLKSDVQIVFKTFTASGKMKLIPLTILILSLSVDVKAHEHFSFPPQFQTPNVGVFSSDSSMYLPPESHTTIPYFPIKNHNNLPFPYLPPTGTKAPVLYQTPYPIMLSSTLLPALEDDEDDNDERPTPIPQYLHNKVNRTQRGPVQKVEKRDLRANPLSNYQHPIDRIDMKYPFPFATNNGPTTPNANMQTPTSRSMIISSDTHRNDHGIVQVKAASFPSSQYLQSPGVFISSTTETSIPILRLSNEMDLDGSFSYEALGADQTHYVQHSHMENMGTDKEEQVVEGSYSYVGDNGQTYTVHYVADSNGFRASGDHLPVAPPVPEIIQRSIQYNLAEEAKKPPHLKSWQNEENEISESERIHRFTAPPPRNLFTGKTPESFSYAFSQGANTPNNLATAASVQTPVKTIIDFTSEQMKGKVNSGTISPQITFVASQGAHVPNVNTPQQTIARMFTTERSTMPQLINYEANMKEPDQENNKALWRWQYGLPNSNANQNVEKNTISRSFGEGDDVMINFNDMTPEQYTKMITSQLEPNNRDNLITSQHGQIDQSNLRNEFQQQNRNPQSQTYKINNEQQNVVLSSESSITTTQFEEWYKQNPYSTSIPYIHQVSEKTDPIQTREAIPDTRTKIITHREFVPPSQTVTQSYDYENIFYEPRKIKVNIDPAPASNMHNFNYNVPYNNHDKTMSTTNLWGNDYKYENRQKISTEPPSLMSSTIGDMKSIDFVIQENKNDFEPLLTNPTQSTEAQQPREIITSTESTTEDMFIENIFLKNIFKPKKNEQDNINRIREDNKNYFNSKINIETKTDKYPLIQVQSKPLDEIKEIKRKPLDISDIMNYITSKNHFESSKIKPKSRFGSNNFNQRSEIRFIPVQQDRNEYEKEQQRIPSNFRTLNNQQQDDLRGIIKNYKVLQRSNIALNTDQENIDQLKRDLSPPPVKMLQKSNSPPLGRAGPSMKSYLPPLYL